MNKRTAQPPILNIENLTIAYRQGKRWLPAVRDISFSIRSGETCGLVGESGSGKTTTVMAVMRYLSENGAIQAGKIELAGRDLLALDEQAMRQVWGKQITLVPQNPQSSLNPSLRIGEQIAEALCCQRGLSRSAAYHHTLELLERVRLADPRRVAESYPHQISGGMQQRVMIAMALSTEPQLIILDEPTTSLDVTTQAAILDLVRELIQEQQTAALYVTHNLGVVAQICDRVVVLYAGELVEEAITTDLFRRPLHPYTQGLLNSVPRLGETKDKNSLRTIQGQIPSLGERPSGCIFSPRCPLAFEKCVERPPLFEPAPGRRLRCYLQPEINRGAMSMVRPAPAKQPAWGETHSPVLQAGQVAVHFTMRRSVNEWLRGKPARKVRAVDGVSLSIPRGRTVGLVGESGSGKTTLARAIMGLVRKTSGEIDLLGVSLPPDLSQRNLETLRRLQMVFQNPEEAFNPYLTIGETLSRPLITLLKKSPQQAEADVANLLAAVRLPASFAGRLPGQLSGGELQRAAIARAFACNPDLLIGDEPVSSLDVSVQASILNLLNELQSSYGTSLFFISHNLAVVGYLADIVAVIYLGKLMETANAGDLFEPPYHPYTEALLSAIPLPTPDAAQKHVRLEGEVPSPMDVPNGCPFHTRCPRCLGEVCKQEIPPWRVDPRTAKRIFCHIPLEELSAFQERIVKEESFKDA